MPTLNNNKVLFILVNDITNDSRVLKEAKSLVDNNYQVTVFCQWIKGQPLIQYINDIKIVRNFDCNFKIIQPSYPSEMGLITHETEANLNKAIFNSYSPAAESGINRSWSNINKALPSYDLPVTEPLPNIVNDTININFSIIRPATKIWRKFKGILKKIPVIKSITRPIINFITLQFIRRRMRMLYGNKILPPLRRLQLKRIFINHLNSNFNDADIIQCHDLVALPYGVALKLLNIKKTKVLIYDTHEYATEVNLLVGSKKKFRALTERIGIKFADHVITVSQSIAEAYKKKYKLKQTPTVVLNCPYYKQPLNKANIFREKFKIPDNKIIFIYQGGFSKHRGIELIVEAFRELKGTNKVVVFMGYGPLLPIIKKETEENENVYYHPTVHPNEILNYTSAADVGLCLYENTCLNHYYCLPNKMFEYSMAGLPLIVSNLYELSKIISVYNHGIIIPEYSKIGLLTVIESITKDKLRDKLINNNIFNKEYNWEAQEKKLLSIYANYRRFDYAFNLP